MVARIRDSVKYRHADTTVDYMFFLEECRKAEDEDGVGKTKAKGKIKIAAATASSPTCLKSNNNNLIP